MISIFRAKLIFTAIMGMFSIQLLAQQLLPFKLPDSGQTGNYTTTEGEDADFFVNPQSFTNNGDGTITDNNTGLMWQKTDGGEMTVENAATYSDNLTLGGYTDWRLPTSIELFSINNYSKVNPAVDTAFFTKTLAQYWWTSEHQGNDLTKIWVVNSGGGIGPHPKTETISAGGTKRFHVRAVRKAITTVFSVPHFTDNGDETITDNYTGLTWQKTPSTTTMTWEAAFAYSNSLSLAGKTDWRLPDIKELQSLNDVEVMHPAFDTTFFTDLLIGNYWSSTSMVNSSAKAWDINSDMGIVSYHDKTPTLEYVLLVRGGFDNSYLNINEIAIPGGGFEMGDHAGFIDPQHPSDELPIHTVTVDTFNITKTEITNQQFLAFLNTSLADGLLNVQNNKVYFSGDTNVVCYTYQFESWYNISYNGSNFSMAGFRANHPMTGVMWYGAAAFCNWLSQQNGLEECYTLASGDCDFTKNGYRLPTEAEWEYAGRGGQNNPYYNYPWGDDQDISKANWPGSGDPYETGSYPYTTPVGFYDGTLKQKSDFNWPGSAATYQTTSGANAYGLYDMAGNVWEFVNDWYGQNYYSNSPVDNPTGPEIGFIMPDGKPYRGMRGGNWYNGYTTTSVNDGHSRVSNRNPSYYRGPQDPNHPWYHIGFRVARNWNYSDTTATEPEENQSRTMGVLIHDTSSVFNGYTLFAPKQNTMTYLINNDGRIIHEWTASAYAPGQSVYLLENGDLLRTCMIPGPLGTGGGEGGRVEKYNWNDSLLWELDYSTATYMQHHDVKQLPNGNIIMLVVEKKTYAEVLAAGFDPSKLNSEILQKGYMLPDYVVEIQPTYPSGGTVVWEWHVWDHLIQDFDATKSNYGVVSANPGLVDCDGDHRNLPLFWNHMNSIDYNPELDQIAVSVRGNSEAWIIDHSTTTAQAAGHTGGNNGKGGDLIYRWGNPLTYGAGTLSNRTYYEQHDVEWVDPGCPGAGNITCYNNGVTLGYSTIIEITTPVDASGNYPIVAGSAFAPVSSAWSYQATPPEALYSTNISGAQRLPNGNTIICEGGHGDITEVTANGEIVWRYICPVDDNGPLIQGDTIPVNPVRSDETMNSVFRVYKYDTSYSAFDGKALIPGEYIETYIHSIHLLLEGLYNGSGTLRAAQDGDGAYWPSPVADKIDIELHDTANFENIVYTLSGVSLNMNGIATFNIPAAYNGSYYLAVKHRNSIATVTATPVSFSSGPISYNFTTLAAKAFGSNQVPTIDGKWAFYSGDVNQDGQVDSLDLILFDNAASNFIPGYLATDVNGDGVVNSNDLELINDNASHFVGVVTP